MAIIKLTKLDNKISLINSQFLLTVEPNDTGARFQMHTGGSLLFGNVKETPEEILRIIEEAERKNISLPYAPNPGYLEYDVQKRIDRIMTEKDPTYGR